MRRIDFRYFVVGVIVAGVFILSVSCTSSIAPAQPQSPEGYFDIIGKIMNDWRRNAEGVVENMDQGKNAANELSKMVILAGEAVDIPVPSACADCQELHNYLRQILNQTRILKAHYNDWNMEGFILTADKVTQLWLDAARVGK